MRVRRLLKMGITELGYRGRQEASKWMERRGWTRRVGRRHRSFLDLDRFNEAGPGRFFSGAANGSDLSDRIPDARSRIVAAAEAVCRGRFDLLGYHKLDFGDPINWHLDPISGRQAPRVHWSRIDPLDPAVIGDGKVIWELNRHQWLIPLGQAYRLTGDERYAEAFAGYLREWIRTNPPGMGINWASSLEVSLRLISWCWALFLFRGSKALSRELFEEMMGGIGSHASHIEKYLSYYFAPNTHLTGEALGLFYAGVVFPEMNPGRRELGMRILVEQIMRQVLSDGVYFEQSTCYQRYTAEIYLHFLILAERNGVAVPAVVRERIRRMFDFLLAVRHPDGSMPQIGDADGGWLMPLASRAPDDPRGVFSTAAALWSRPEYAWAAGGLAPETLWLLGPAGGKVFEALRPAPPAIAASRLFADGGYAVMRSGWEVNAHHLIFDVGPLGCPVSSGHGHADLLSLQCSVFGEPCLVDPGTYGYTVEPAWRDHFRGTAAHSTVIVDGEGQAAPAGPFRWESRPQATLRRWLSTEEFDLADAEHDAYRRLSDPVVHRRRVLFVKPRYWVVVDDLQGKDEHRVDLRFQFAPMKVMMDRDRWVRAQGAGEHGLFIRAFAPVRLHAEVREGEPAPIQGWVSPDYGRRRPAPVLVYSAVTRLPLRIVTLLFPIQDPSGSPPDVFVTLGQGRDPVALNIYKGGDVKEIILLEERKLLLEGRGIPCAGSWEF